MLSWAVSLGACKPLLRLYRLAVMTTVSTIFALSSGAGRAGIAVIRLSGPRVRDVVAAMAAPLPAARKASVRWLKRASDGAPLDQALVLWLPGPGSFTGEDCAEFHVHGGRAVVAGVLAALASFEGLRLAEPGEFTRRAFEHGRLDLTAAEGLADLIDAETEAQRTQALRQMGGGLAEAAERWRADIVTAMGLVEAAIDFSDEGDVSERAVSQARAIIAGLQGQLEAALADGRRGEILRDGFRVVIAGPPNAGKSSLLNALARRDVAIVSDEPGTTRDVVEVRLDVGGVPVLVMDTAGIRDAPGKVEREGVRRSLARAQDADLVLWVVDGSGGHVALPGAFAKVVNKADLIAEGGARDSLRIAALTGAGLDALLALIGDRAGAGSREPALITQVRHRALIEAAAGACRQFLDGEQSESELRAEDLRQAAHALGKLTGRVDVEEVLGEIFGRFCIGK
jgi:tRNA modification GTPase